MTQQIINIGNAPNDGSGDQLRTSFDKCNLNFAELYQGLVESLPLGNAIEYDFNVTTAEPPASAEIRFDHPQASATKLWASQTTSSGINIKQFLSAAAAGSRIILQDKIDNTNYVKLNVTGAPVDKGTYWEFPVAVTASGGNLPSASILVSVTPAIGGGTSITPSDTNPLIDGTAAPGTSALYSRGDHVHPTDTSRAAISYVDSQDALKAPLASPTFTGDPKAPTPATNDNDTSIATTQFIQTAIATRSVRYDTAQTLTAAQKAQARANIDCLKKNYIINGGMMVSQENGATAGTASGYYPVDQWIYVFSSSGQVSIAQVSSNTPSGSTSRIRCTVNVADPSITSGDYAVLQQRIEGNRAVDLMMGTAAAKTITIAFGVKAPAGTYCIALKNEALNRAYVAEYVIAAGEANTDVYKSVTIILDTTGTWTRTNTVGLYVQFTLMSAYNTPANVWTAGNFDSSAIQFNFMGTTSNVFELFDVGLYEGPVAPSFQVPDYASELALCKRYWERYRNYSVAYGAVGSSTVGLNFPFSVEKRAAPTTSYASGPTLNNCGVASGTPSVKDYAVVLNVTATGLYVYDATINVNARL